MKIYPIIMAGGSGTRFWPRSRNTHPKQFLSITSTQYSMLQLARNRLTDIANSEDIFILTNIQFLEKIKKQLPDIPTQNIILEPTTRDTAPCIGLAASIIKQKDPNGIMLVMPCDHWIEPIIKFTNAVKLAAELAKENGQLITFGIQPTYPATCYGYIEKSNHGIIQNDLSIFTVERFQEKPNEETAKLLLASKKHLWNSGIFIWKPQSILSNIESIMPDLASGLNEMAQNNFKNIAEIYPKLPKISIDFGIMEKAKNIKVIAVDYLWDDIGSWESLNNHFALDKQQNLIQGEVVAIDSHNSIIINDNENTLIATIGTDNLLIVKSGDALLVAPRNKGQEIKKLIEKLNKQNRQKYL